MKQFLKKIARSQRWMVRMYFERKYAQVDPYSVTQSEFEIRKLNEVEKHLRSLAAQPFAEALEIGCGEGILAGRLADRFLSYEGIDISKRALKRARERNRDAMHLRFRKDDFLTMKLPAGIYDLILFSEVLFYFPIEAVDRFPLKTWEALRPGGLLALVHCRANGGDDESGTMTKTFGAKTIHDRFIDDPHFTCVEDHWDPEFRLTVLQTRQETTPVS